MNGRKLRLALALLLAAGAAWGRPTERELEEKLVPILVMRDIIPIRLAGLDGDGDQLKAEDLASSDQGMWEPGLFTVRCRVYFRATEDVYAQAPLSAFRWWQDRRTEGEAGLRELPDSLRDRQVFVRVARKGERIAILYEFETERKDGQWEFVKEPYPGKIEWPGGVTWPTRARSCWEEWGRQTGKPVEFYGSEGELKSAMERLLGLR